MDYQSTRGEKVPSPVQADSGRHLMIRTGSCTLRPKKISTATMVCDGRGRRLHPESGRGVVGGIMFMQGVYMDEARKARAMWAKLRVA